MNNNYLPSLAGLAVCAFTFNAHAMIITASDSPGLAPVTASLDFSANAVGLFNLSAPSSITTAGGAALASTSKTNPLTGVTSYDSLSLSAPLVSVSYDTAYNNRLLTEQLAGAVTITNSGRNDAGTGGSLTISNLSIDFEMLSVTATLTGANGVGTHEGVRLFYFDNMGEVSVSPGLQYIPPVQPTPTGYPYANPYNMPSPTPVLNMNLVPETIPSLRLTADGAQLWGSSMGYNSLGSTALRSVLNFGSINIPAVPEAGTWSTLSLGLIGIVAASRRHRQRQAA
jgi:hypothetical protein